MKRIPKISLVDKNIDESTYFYRDMEMARSDLDEDVLKISHHGSRYSNSAVFLNKVKPDYAVISVGKGNDYNLPAEITLNKLNYLNLRIYRTDIDGTIISTSDGNNIVFETISTDTNG